MDEVTKDGKVTSKGNSVHLHNLSETDRLVDDWGSEGAAAILGKTVRDNYDSSFTNEHAEGVIRFSRFSRKHDMKAAIESTEAYAANQANIVIEESGLDFNINESTASDKE
ncbi:hypothetical protein [Vreelandella sp. H-I2]